MKDDLNSLESKMKKVVDLLKENLARLRAGRANPAVLEKMTVDYYGVPTPIIQLANVSVPEARMIVIQPWEAKLLKEMEKAILVSDLGINPNNDGKVLRLIFPPLTEERRRDLTRTVRKAGEEAKVEVRLFRRDAIEEYKKQQKNSVITEDDLKDLEKEIQDLTDIYVENIDEIIAQKDREIMEV